MYKVIYKDVVLFHDSNKDKIIDAIISYVEKRGLNFYQRIEGFGRTNLLFYDVNGYYTYTIIKEDK